LRILVVDDSDDKRTRVTQVLRDKLAGRALSICEAANYEDAIDALRNGFFDLVILDLLLPAAGGQPSEDTSRALIGSILKGKLVPPTHIIGLTEYHDVGEQERRYYDEHLFALEFYSAENLAWADRIINKIKYLVQSKNAALQFQASSYDLDVFVLAARYENEYVPIRRRLFKHVEAAEHPIWRGELALGTLKFRNERVLRCGLACISEMGMAPAAATQAISVFRPRLLAMLGMCCGFAVEECASPRKFMDAIVVRQVACWEEGKYVDQSKSGSEFRNRAKSRMVDDTIRDAVDEAVEQSAEAILPKLRRFSEQTEYRKIREHFGAAEVRDVPDVRFGMLVTGSSVIADEAMVREILHRHPSAIGLDMELYGVYTAADRSLGRRPSVLGVKGVADFGHAEKDDFAQKGASVVATEVFKAILPSLGIFDY
jgi:nucleoside phosphorylase